MKKIIYWIRGRSDGAAITVLLILIFLAINPFGILGFWMRIGIGLPLLILFGVWVSSKPNAMSLLSKIKSTPKLLYWENLVTLIFFFGTAAYFTFLTELTFEPAPLLITSTFYLWMYLCTRRRHFPTRMFKISGTDLNIVSEVIHFMYMASPASAIYIIGMLWDPTHFKTWLALSIVTLFFFEEYIYGIMAKNLKIDIMLGYRARSRTLMKLKTQEGTTLKFLSVRIPVDIIQGSFKIPLGLKWGGGEDLYDLRHFESVSLDLMMYDNDQTQLKGTFALYGWIESPYMMDQIGGKDFQNTLKNGQRDNNNFLNTLAAVIEKVSTFLKAETIFEIASFGVILDWLLKVQTQGSRVSTKDEDDLSDLIKRQSGGKKDPKDALKWLRSHGVSSNVIRMSSSGEYWDGFNGAFRIAAPIIVGNVVFADDKQQEALEREAKEARQRKGDLLDNQTKSEQVAQHIAGGMTPRDAMIAVYGKEITENLAIVVKGLFGK